MNIGYVILALVLFTILVDLIIVVANAISDIFEFCKGKKSKKIEDKYKGEVDSQCTT